MRDIDAELDQIIGSSDEKPLLAALHPQPDHLEGLKSGSWSPQRPLLGISCWCRRETRQAALEGTTAAQEAQWAVV